MADETLYESGATAVRFYQSIIRWVDPSIHLDSYIIQRTLNTSTAKAGDVMTGSGETQGLVAEAAEADTSWLGILMGPVRPTDAYSLDDVIDTGETVNILRPTAGRTMVSVIMNSSGTATADWDEGDFVRVADSAGKLELFVFVEAADSTDTCELIIGRAAETVEVSATDDQVAVIWY